MTFVFPVKVYICFKTSDLDRLQSENMKSLKSSRLRKFLCISSKNLPSFVRTNIIGYITTIISGNWQSVMHFYKVIELQELRQETFLQKNYFPNTALP